ncbi:hypothetical protein NBO_10g0060 [Nosema bombycis CQ1]|uniref:Uncharacterized protein n=1 Tax=Nosema bombycis (strain CQ1 / CVCC 102059) TaxID=578461 RepID=R0MLF0_NOSB1|nr:hypothetical protein NBO_10g0060 [Nosema bombycis CQ1]|eukprot:EOB15070.1 hypothetical protein NBO_10g0060 [Nosema bombycis CQ1]
MYFNKILQQHICFFLAICQLIESIRLQIELQDNNLIERSVDNFLQQTERMSPLTNEQPLQCIYCSMPSNSTGLKQNEHLLAVDNRLFKKSCDMIKQSNQETEDSKTSTLNLYRNFFGLVVLLS